MSDYELIPEYLARTGKNLKYAELRSRYPNGTPIRHMLIRDQARYVGYALTDTLAYEFKDTKSHLKETAAQIGCAVVLISGLGVGVLALDYLRSKAEAWRANQLEGCLVSTSPSLVAHWMPDYVERIYGHQEPTAIVVDSVHLMVAGGPRNSSPGERHQRTLEHLVAIEKMCR